MFNTHYFKISPDNKVQPMKKDDQNVAISQIKLTQPNNNQILQLKKEDSEALTFGQNELETDNNQQKYIIRKNFLTENQQGKETNYIAQMLEQSKKIRNEILENQNRHSQVQFQSENYQLSKQNNVEKNDNWKIYDFIKETTQNDPFYMQGSLQQKPQSQLGDYKLIQKYLPKENKNLQQEVKEMSFAQNYQQGKHQQEAKEKIQVNNDQKNNVLIEQLQQEKENSQKDNQKLSQEVQRLNSFINEMNSNKEELQLKKRITQMETEIEFLRIENTEKNAQIIELQQKLEQEHSQKKQESKDESLSQQIEELNQENNKLSNILEHKENHIKKLEVQQANDIIQIKDLQRKLLDQQIKIASNIKK